MKSEGGLKFKRNYMSIRKQKLHESLFEFISEMQKRAFTSLEFKLHCPLWQFMETVINYHMQDGLKSLITDCKRRPYSMYSSVDNTILVYYTFGTSPQIHPMFNNSLPECK